MAAAAGRKAVHGDLSVDVDICHHVARTLGLVLAEARGGRRSGEMDNTIAPSIARANYETLGGGEGHDSPASAAVALGGRTHGDHHSGGRGSRDLRGRGGRHSGAHGEGSHRRRGCRGSRQGCLDRGSGGGAEGRHREHRRGRRDRFGCYGMDDQRRDCLRGVRGGSIGPIAGKL